MLPSTLSSKNVQPEVTMRIKDSVALVTGGNRGIGEAFVRGLLESGARRVYVGSRAVANASKLVSEFGDRALAVKLDVTDPADIAAAAALADEVSILINNAGEFAMGRLISDPDMSKARREMDVNYFAPLAMCRAFAPVLARSPESAIVNVLSAGGLVAIPGMGGYSPSKFAARAMTTCVRAELAPQNTQVIGLIVGSVDTRMAQHVVGLKEPPSAIAKAGLKAIERGVDEVDTDLMAIEVRASLARDPKALELQMRRSLSADPPRTGR